MIFYDYMNEGWSDSEDDDFFVDMTPEGDESNLTFTFDDKESFYIWYYNSSLNERLFTVAVNFSKGLISSYVFKDHKSAERWLKFDLPNVLKKYDIKHTQCSFKTLPKLKVGDQCRVMGESSKLFKIVGVEKYEDHRYGFILFDGEDIIIENVEKCLEVYS